MILGCRGTRRRGVRTSLEARLLRIGRVAGGMTKPLAGTQAGQRRLRALGRSSRS